MRKEKKYILFCSAQQQSTRMYINHQFAFRHPLQAVHIVVVIAIVVVRYLYTNLVAMALAISIVEQLVLCMRSARRRIIQHLLDYNDYQVTLQEYSRKSSSSNNKNNNNKQM